MAFKKTLAQRLFGISRISNRALTNCRVSSPCTAVQSKALNHQTTTPNRLAPDPGDDGIFRRHLHRFSAATSPGLRFLPTGENLLEKLREMDIARDRIRLDGLRPAAPEEEAPAAEVTLSLKDAVKILRLSQLETVKSRLRQIEKDCISHPEFLEICAKECSSVDQAEELAKMLDVSGSVIVLGNIVFLRPEQDLLKRDGGESHPRPNPYPLTNPPRRSDQGTPGTGETEGGHRQKSGIERSSGTMVWIRLSGCPNSSLHEANILGTFMGCNGTYLLLRYILVLHGRIRILPYNTEPFEGFFQSRFSAKQKRLMKAQNFDVGRYNELKKLACFSPQSPGMNAVMSLASS
ncbi:Calcium uniporter protein 2, mitochondrial [Sesamum angolense]|uniref:Calcium uniporter protein 2, mitochondrial n=1 Tax=Sesamum angolense TaxID=2727404 RepID=A0AAE1WHG0_9LAMI|nr:Calcium uniporter protein 2, mitochondrial [Sesamum angolense]